MKPTRTRKAEAWWKAELEATRYRRERQESVAAGLIIAVAGIGVVVSRDAQIGLGILLLLVGLNLLRRL